MPTVWHWHSLSPWGGGLKLPAERFLSPPPPPAQIDEARKFFQHSGQTLTFLAAWDDRESLYGELRRLVCGPALTLTLYACRAVCTRASAMHPSATV